MKKPKVFFTVADDKNMPYATKMINSLRKFHSEEELPVVIYTEKEVGDPTNFYRQKAMFARELINEYDLVIGADADQIITGPLDYLFEGDYDMGGVLNFSRVDVQKYGVVTTLDIAPQAYFNCGLVAMKSKQFVDHWWALCNSYHFNNYQYREQDLMNIMIHYGHYKIKCFDHADPETGYSAWHGLLSKGEWHRMILKDGKLVLPAGDDKYPDHDKEIKVMHFAGGQNNPEKMNYRLFCSEEVISHLDGLIR